MAFFTFNLKHFLNVLTIATEHSAWLSSLEVEVTAAIGIYELYYCYCYYCCYCYYYY